MSRSIKISEESYQTIREMQGPRETYKDVVERLLDMWRMLRGLEPLLSGHKAYQEFLNRDQLVKQDSYGREVKPGREGQP